MQTKNFNKSIYPFGIFWIPDFIFIPYFVQQSQKVSMNGLPYNNNNYYKYKSHNSSHKNICTKYATSHFLNVPGSKQN